MTAEAARNRLFSETFAKVAEQVDDWTAPTPVPEWRAKDIVEHLLDWFPEMLHSWTGLSLEPRTESTLLKRWRVRADEVQTLLEDDAISGRAVEAGPFAGQELRAVIDQLYTADIFMHTWDLARAADVPAPLDSQYAADLLAGLQRMEDVIRASGQFGTAKETDSTHSVDRLMAFIGREV
ncbi:MAG TPA: TIGR03086 family protein [Candidatus Agrococcus pullicola]|uniref:TIGR03086 family protein n=1 Tax=Candidatus Agrococcus pullicola TaxID=2838429 RepID=A0A9D2CA93_9MICO|nr:TIGR03086 family protein [Candidatus Agrococcus pullicola]